MPAVTSKATRPGGPWGPGHKDQEKGAASPITKGTQGPGEGGVQGREPRGRARGPERTVGWRHGWMDRRREEGRMDGWMDGPVNECGEGRGPVASQAAGKSRKGAGGVGQKAKEQGGRGGGHGSGVRGKHVERTVADGESPRQVQEGRKLGAASKEKEKSKHMGGTGIGHRQRQRWAGWAAGGVPALGPGGAEEEEQAGTRTRWVLCLGGRGAGRRLPSAAPLSWRGPGGGRGGSDGVPGL